MKSLGKPNEAIDLAVIFNTIFNGDRQKFYSVKARNLAINDFW